MFYVSVLFLYHCTSFVRRTLMSSRHGDFVFSPSVSVARLRALDRAFSSLPFSLLFLISPYRRFRRKRGDGRIAYLKQIPSLRKSSLLLKINALHPIFVSSAERWESFSIRLGQNSIRTKIRIGVRIGIRISMDDFKVSSPRQYLWSSG